MAKKVVVEANCDAIGELVDSFFGFILSLGFSGSVGLLTILLLEKIAPESGFILSIVGDAIAFCLVIFCLSKVFD